MIVHGVGAASELLRDGSHGLPLDEQLKDMLLAIGEPGARVVDELKRSVRPQAEGCVDGADERERFAWGRAGRVGSKPKEINQAQVRGLGPLDRDNLKDGVNELGSGEQLCDWCLRPVGEQGLDRGDDPSLQRGFRDGNPEFGETLASILQRERVSGTHVVVSARIGKARAG